jgi:hypothetical protein
MPRWCVVCDAKRGSSSIWSLVAPPLEIDHRTGRVAELVTLNLRQVAWRAHCFVRSGQVVWRSGTNANDKHTGPLRINQHSKTR